MERYAIYGRGGNGRELLSVVRDMVTERHEGGAVVFASDVAEEVGTVANGVDVIAFDELISAGHRDRKVILSLGSSAGRRILAEKCEAEGLQFTSIAATSHKRFDDVTIGEGGVFSDFTMCPKNVQIGCHFQCNMYS